MALEGSKWIEGRSAGHVKKIAAGGLGFSIRLTTARKVRLHG